MAARGSKDMRCLPKGTQTCRRPSSAGPARPASVGRAHVRCTRGRGSARSPGRRRNAHCARVQWARRSPAADAAGDAEAHDGRACDDAADVTSMRRQLGGFLAAALLIAVVVVAWRFTVSVQRASARAAAWESAAATVQADIAVGHVWLEELLAGDRSVDVRRDVRGPFVAAAAGCRALRDGGRTPDGSRIAAAADEPLRRDVIEACRRVDVVRAMTNRRLAGRTAAGSPADARYDAAFRSAFALAQGLPQRLRELGGTQEAR